jgi:hypothetical protein
MVPHSKGRLLDLLAKIGLAQKLKKLTNTTAYSSVTGGGDK